MDELRLPPNSEFESPLGLLDPNKPPGFSDGAAPGVVPAPNALGAVLPGVGVVVEAPKAPGAVVPGVVLVAPNALGVAPNAGAPNVLPGVVVAPNAPGFGAPNAPGVAGAPKVPAGVAGVPKAPGFAAPKTPGEPAGAPNADGGDVAGDAWIGEPPFIVPP